MDVVGHDNGCHWQMTNCERASLISVLRQLSPEVAIEVGTYQGGSLQVIQHYSKSVISIDIDPSVETRLKGLFENVNFLCGDSHSLLPDALSLGEKEGRKVEFILIDGDHSEDGVRRDINAVMQWQPQSRCVVLIHDSFNPNCREGIKTADWGSSPHVQSVELDYCPGIYHQEAYDTAEARTMWGGLALAELTPEKRVGELTIKASQQGLFDAVYKVSSHSTPKTIQASLTAIVRRLRGF